MDMIGNAFAENAAPAPPPPSFMGILPPLLLMMAIFYFLLIRPQQKKQKERDEMLKNLKEGNSVITSGGVYGTIAKIKEDILTLKIADNVKIKIDRSAVTGLKSAPK